MRRARIIILLGTCVALAAVAQSRTDVFNINNVTPREAKISLLPDAGCCYLAGCAEIASNAGDNVMVGCSNNAELVTAQQQNRAQAMLNAAAKVWLREQKFSVDAGL